MEEHESKLHGLLKSANPAKPPTGNIFLYDRLWEIKTSAGLWLNGYGKNGLEHSQRVESYLDSLTCDAYAQNKLNHAEIFILLCAVYMHDLGYLLNGKLEGKEHERRSREIVEKDYRSLCLGDFPIYGDGKPRVVEAIGLVCMGHAKETTLPLFSDSLRVFFDQALGDNPIDLRKLVAFLRIADEADDAYTRLSSPSLSVRSRTALVDVRDHKIIWHRDLSVDPRPFEDLLVEKKRNLASSQEYLRQIDCGDWDLMLHPQLITSVPFMSEDPVETFVGREKDIDTIHSILREHGHGAIAGVVGTGGIGKTELAKMYAKRFRAEYRDGVFWVSLRGNQWREEARHILTALYGSEILPFPNDYKAKNEVCKRLNLKNALLVIDNVEDIDQIVRPGCDVLVTTRDRRVYDAVPIEGIKEIDRLSQSEGALLLEKALGKDRIARDKVGADRIVEILGGLPLALEIAARHLQDAPDLSFPDYIGAIQGKLQELKLGGREDRNVMASIEVSLRQLETTVSGRLYKSLFQAGSVCAESGFTSLTLGAVIGREDLSRSELAQAAGQLYRRCLLELVGKRFRMHPLLRQLSAFKLAEDSNKQSFYRTNHCFHFLRYVEANSAEPGDLILEKDGVWQAMVQTHQIGLSGKILPTFLEHLARPYQQLLERKQYETALLYLFRTNVIKICDLGMSRELADMLSILTSEDACQTEILRGAIYETLGNTYLNLGEYGKAIDCYEKALETAKSTGDIGCEGGDLSNIGNAYLNLGEYRKAIDHYGKALEIAQLAGNMRAQADNLGNTGVAYKELGEYRRAIGTYEKALEIHRRTGDTKSQAGVLGNIGVAYAKLGEYRKAIEIYENVVESVREIGDVLAEGRVIGNMGSAYMQLGQYARSIELYEKALEIARSIKDTLSEGNHLCNMGSAYMQLGQYARSIELYEKALEIHRRIGYVPGQGNDLLNIGWAHSKAGDQKRGAECFQESRLVFKRLGLQHMVQFVDDMAKGVGL